MGFVAVFLTASCVTHAQQLMPLKQKSIQQVSIPKREKSAQEIRDSIFNSKPVVIYHEDSTRVALFYHKLDSCNRIVNRLNSRLDGMSYYYVVRTDKYDVWQYNTVSTRICEPSGHYPENVRIEKIYKPRDITTFGRTYYRDDLWCK